MKTLKFYSIILPFSGEAKEEMEEYKILATNKYGKLVINDYSFTTLQFKKEKHASNHTINEVSVWKSKYGWDSDGWRAQVYFQCSENIMRKKVLNALKKEMQKEMFLDSKAFKKLELIIRKRK